MDIDKTMDVDRRGEEDMFEDISDPNSHITSEFFTDENGNTFEVPFITYDLVNRLNCVDVPDEKQEESLDEKPDSRNDQKNLDHQKTKFEKYWCDEGPNLYRTGVKDFKSLKPAASDYLRWSRPAIDDVYKEQMLNADSDLVVVGCKATYHETSDVVKRLYRSTKMDSHKHAGRSMWNKNKSPDSTNSRLTFLYNEEEITEHQIPVIHLFCLDKTGRSICVNVHGFFPYVYTEVDPALYQNSDHLNKIKHILCENYARSLEKWIDSMNKRNKYGNNNNNNNGYKKQFPQYQKKWKRKSESEYDENESIPDDYFRNQGEETQKNNASTVTHKNIVSIDIVSRISLDGAHKENAPMFRIKFATPIVISRFRNKYMDDGFLVHDVSRSENPFKFGGKGKVDKTGKPVESLTFDSCIRFENRFFVDTGLHGGAWFKIAQKEPKQIRYYKDNLSVYKSKYGYEDAQQCHSRCQVELDIHYTSIETYNQYDPQYSNFYNNPIVGARILSYDIECIGKLARFPHPSKDPLVCINVYATKDSRYPTIFSSKEEDYNKPDTIHERDSVLSICFSVSTSLFERDNPEKKVLRGFADKSPTVFSFKDEKEMLEAFCDFINIFDPDVITGYNSTNFDIPQVVERCKALGIDSSLTCARLLTEELTYVNKELHHEKKGSVAFKVIDCPGRLLWDVHPFIKEDFATKLSSYSLNSVASYLFKETKDDMNHTTLPIYYRSGPSFRDVVRVYCEKDAFLALRIFLTKQIWGSRIEASRVSGTRLEQEESDGPAAKAFPHITRCANKDGYIMPWRHFADRGEKYEGAIVQNPQVGFHYKYLIAFFDYLSEYPATMRAWNICMSTYVSPEQWPYIRAKYGPDCCNVCPFVGHRFLKPEIREGVLPKVQTFLMNRRTFVKDLMKVMIKGSNEIKVADNRQNQLKLKANGLYGVTGVVNNGFFWKIPIAESVTAWARDQINTTVSILKSFYPDCEIIYGDTDSVLVIFKDLPYPHKGTKEEKAQIDKITYERMVKIADYITTQVKAPNELKPEFLGWPMLLISRKKYAVLKRERITDVPKMDIKGLDSARRSTCAYTAESQKECIKILLEEVDVPKAFNYALKRTIDLATYKFNYADLVLSTRLNKKPDFQRDSHTVRPQEYLYQRMNEIDPNATPNLGDRVPYMIRMGDSKKQKNFSKAIHPTELLGRNAQKLDLEYYFEKQFLKPLSTIFKYIDPPENDSWLLIKDKKFAKKYDTPLTDYFSKVETQDTSPNSTTSITKTKKLDEDEEDEALETPKIKANRLEFESRLRMEFKTHLIINTVNDVYWLDELDKKTKRDIDSLLEISGQIIQDHKHLPIPTDTSNSSSSSTTTIVASEVISPEAHGKTSFADGLDENIDEPMFDFPKPKTNIADHHKTSYGTRDLRSFDVKCMKCVVCSMSINPLVIQEASFITQKREDCEKRKSVKDRRDKNSYMYTICTTCFNHKLHQKFGFNYEHLLKIGSVSMKKEKKEEPTPKSGKGVKRKRSVSKKIKQTPVKKSKVQSSCPSATTSSSCSQTKKLDSYFTKTKKHVEVAYETPSVPEPLPKQTVEVPKKTEKQLIDEQTIYLEIISELEEEVQTTQGLAIKKWKTCKDCMGAKFEKDACSNYECKNWFQRGDSKSLFTTAYKKKIDLDF